MSSDRASALLARLIPVRPWIALVSFLVGVLVTVPAFYYHEFWLAVAGLLPLGGALVVLLVPLPFER